MISQKIKNFFKKNKKNFYYSGFFVVIFLMSGEVSFAGEETTQLANEVIGGVNALFQIIGGVLGILTQIVGVLLTPDWVNGSVIGISDHIKNLWVMVSNVVYFIFAFLLIAIAFMNIVGGKGDKWELKQALPKFIIGVLIVPFSWFFVQFIISLSSILSASILALPFNTIGADYVGKLDEIEVCVDMTLRKPTTEANTNIEPCKKYAKINEVLKGKGMYGLINIYTYGIFKIDSFPTVPEQAVSGGLITNLLNLGIAKVAHIVFIIIYTILVISLALALFTRMVWLWLYMVFSPVFGLLFFFGKEKDSGILDGKFSVTQFIGLAMVPVYVSAALAFGFLFIITIGVSLGDNQEVTNKLIKISKFDEEGITMSKISILDVSEGEGGEYSGTYNFSLEGDLTNDSGDGDSISKILGGFQGAVGTLLLQLLGLVILWISVMMALKGSKVTGEVVQPIADFGKQVGSLVQKSPQYAPVFGGQSMQSMKRVSGTVQSHFDTKSSKRATEFLKNTPFGESSKVLSGLQDIRTGLANNSISDASSQVEAVRKTLSLAKGDTKQLYNDEQFQKTLFDLGEKVLTPKGMKELSIESYDQINSLDKLTELISKIDHKAGYEGVFKGTVALGANQGSKLEQLVKELGGGISSVASDNGGKNTKSPLIDINKEVDKNTGEVELKVDNDTVVFLNSDGTFKDDRSKNDLVNHLINDNTIGSMTKGELKTWLENNGIGKDGDDRNSIIDGMKTKIETLIDSNGEELNNDTFYK